MLHVGLVGGWGGRGADVARPSRLGAAPSRGPHGVVPAVTRKGEGAGATAQRWRGDLPPGDMGEAARWGLVARGPCLARFG